jgi:hypothetical protein
MLNYSFVKTPEELDATVFGGKVHSSNFYMQEKIQLYWTTDEQTVRHVLPPHVEPFMPNGKPVILAYISFFGRPETHYPYTEGALFILAKCKNSIGVYTLAMPLDTNDQATARGREMYGYPKKAARVKLVRRGDKVYGWIERNDVRFFEAEMTIGAPLNDPILGPKTLGKEGPQTENGEVILLKYDLDASRDQGEPFGMHNFRLQARNNFVTFHQKSYGHVDNLIIRPSEDDPWIELAPRSEEDIFGAAYFKYETQMKKSRTLYTFAPEETRDVLPYAFTSWDSVVFGKEHSCHRSENIRY